MFRSSGSRVCSLLTPAYQATIGLVDRRMLTSYSGIGLLRAQMHTHLPASATPMVISLSFMAV